MIELFAFNSVLIAVMIPALVWAKKHLRTARGKQLALLAAPILTIVCHYSSLLYHQLSDGTAMNFLMSNPNLLLPIYPCNVVMWCCLLFGLIRNKSSRAAGYLADYIFWFGVFSAVLGMFINVDFIREPTLLNFDITKGIVAHAFMLFNVLLLPVLGFIQIDLPKNYRHILLSMVMMFMLGCYCNVVFEALASKETAYAVNSMFLLHSPFPDVPVLTYPLICLAAAVVYFAVFCLCELFAYPKNRRWIARYFGRKPTDNASGQ